MPILFWLTVNALAVGMLIGETITAQLSAYDACGYAIALGVSLSALLVVFDRSLR
jgi:hypothetical protein